MLLRTSLSNFYNLRQYQSFKNLGSQQGKGKYTYRRNHEDNYLCTEAEIRRMFADANHHRDSNVRWTHRIYGKQTSIISI